jgi:Tol biopolymer transport system component
MNSKLKKSLIFLLKFYAGLFIATILVILLGLKFTSNPNIISELIWSPDGEWLSFTTNSLGKRDNIFIFNVKNRTVKQLTEDNHYKELALWPNPDNLFFVDQTKDGLYSLNPNNEEITLIEKEIKGFGSNTNFQILAFHKLDSLSKDIIQVIDENNETRIIEKGSGWKDLSNPRVSPDGKLLTYQILNSRNYSYASRHQIRVYDLLNNQEIVSFAGTNPSWSPDNKKIVFIDGSRGLGIYDLNSRSAKQVVAPKIRSLSWHPYLNLIAFSDDRKDGWMIKIINLETSGKENILDSSYVKEIIKNKL